MTAWEVWASLRKRFGDPALASKLPMAERKQAISERRALRIERNSDGFGSGSVRIERLTKASAEEGGAWSSSVDICFLPPAVISDEEATALSENQYESWNDLPGIPS